MQSLIRVLKIVVHVVPIIARINIYRVILSLTEVKFLFVY